MKATKEQIEGLYIGQNLSTLKCAKVLGYSSASGIIHLLRKFGIKSRPKGRFDHRVKGISKSTLENLYINQGLSVRECAKVLGLPTHGAVVERLHEYGIKTRVSKFQKGNEINKGRDPEKCSGWKGGKQIVKCSYCGKQLLRFPSTTNETNFCDFSCKGKWESENLRGEANPNFGNSTLVGRWAGEKHPNWMGGISAEPYAPIWIDKRFKAGIRERDNHTCQNPECRHNDNILTIHHIDYDKKNCDERNLITLCRACNGRANFNRDFWEAGYREIIRQKYEAYDQQIAI